MTTDDYEFTRETASQIIAELKAIKASLRTSYLCDEHKQEQVFEVPEKTCVICLLDENDVLKRSLFRIERAIQDAKYAEAQK